MNEACNGLMSFATFIYFSISLKTDICHTEVLPFP